MRRHSDCIRLWLSLLVISCSFILSGSICAQEPGIIVQGKVYDQNDQPVVGASVLIQGTRTGAVTGDDGTFEIRVPDVNTVLEVSFLGYVTQTRTVGMQDWIDFFLEEDRKTLDAVVVVAYGTQTKATVTGALSTMEAEKLTNTTVADFTNILAGQLPGVSTIQTTGQPGADNAKIFVRGAGSLNDGASSPLILVDGIERPMSSIDPNEIESLSILKDASSTAVFGVRGANGVILVTTKRGEIGKPKISINSSVGVQHPMSYVEQVGSYEYARFWNMKQQNDGVTDPKRYFSDYALEAYRTGSDPIMFPNVKWSELLYKDMFIQTKHNINISGGTENVRYFVSMGLFYQDGLLKQIQGLEYDNNYKYNRYNFRANLDFKLTSTTQMKLNIGGYVGKSQEPKVEADMAHVWNHTRIWALPMVSPGMIDGVRTLVPNNILPGLEMRDGYRPFYGYGYKHMYRSSLNLDMELTQRLDFITDGLSISAKGGYDMNMNMDKIHSGSGAEYQTVYYKTNLEDNTIPFTDPDFDKTYVFVPAGSDSALAYSETYGYDRNWYMEFRADYRRKFNGKHSVTALLLYNQSQDSYPGTYSYLPRGYVGFVGRVTYGYKDKYLFDFSAGYNGSENFAPGKTRYGFFPSGSVGYVISEEEFMKRQNVIDFLKIRASVGLVGNDLGTTSRFMYMEGVWNPAGNYSFGVDNPNGVPYYTMGTPGNPGVTWEKALKYNVGLDLNMFGSRFSLTADWFFEDRTGILVPPNSMPAIIATSLPNLNIGEVENTGYEISVGWSDTRPSSFYYSIDANVSFARNRIIYMDEVKSEFAYQNQTGGSTGRKTGLYKFVRLYNENDFIYDSGGNMVLNPDLPQPNAVVYPGDAMYADLNDDGVVDGNDTMVYGFSTRPEYVFGLNGTFGYKGFSVTMNWIGATNVDKMMELDYRIPFTNAGNRGLIEFLYEDCWSPENPQGTLPRAAETSEGWNSSNSTLWLRDASYIRLKSLSVGYRFSDNKFFRKLGISSLELLFTGYNLITFSPMKFEDPETVSNNRGEYPLVKTYNLGLNINF